MRAAVIATGWLGDTIACSAAATSLAEKGYKTTLFIRWPQLKPILDKDKRFITRTYWHIKLLKLFMPIINRFFDLVIWEPSGWSYKEPFTSEMRRLAGCDPKPEYSLSLIDGIGMKELVSNKNLLRPVICISRDLYKRNYERDVKSLICQLSKFAEIQWVGLNPNQSSKHGKRNSLLLDAQSIIAADLFVGPEGGMLWLAAGLGKASVYFTEHILAVESFNGHKELDKVLGSKNYFPKESIYMPLPPYCSNEDAAKIIQKAIQVKR